MSPRGGAQSKIFPPAALPSGEVTFLFSDIEGSTSRWEQHHDAMKVAVARHDSLIRAEIERHGGYVFKTVGDAFCAAFGSPQQALQAALAGQHRLYKEDFSEVGGLRVRMGVHAGTAVERDLDYYGPTVNRVARLMSIGHGGQILISEAVRHAVADGLPGGASLVDLGMRRLKDLMQPEHVWQVSIAGLPSDFAPLKSLDARPNNLPVQSTALVGRERELGSVKQLVASHRLVTISGAGGVGKTRVALQIGADLIDHYERGVWFADLAPISDGGLVPSTIARALEVTQSGDAVESSLLRSLKHRELLLILDNCEHVLESVAPLADAILKACPLVRILTTSRQPLGVAGEFVHRLSSLSVPEASTSMTADEAQRYGATALFIERATAADSRFVLTDDSAPIVVDICRRLDGIPLAIELAAARINVLALPNLARRLDERFKILTGGSRTALPRQKTLGALIDWSYGLLDEDEKTLFKRLGIFAGGFTFEAAMLVCSGDGTDETAILNLLSSLADKSLVLADTSGDGERYRLLESTRAYALEKLSETGTRDLLARRHAEYFRTFAEAAKADHRSRPAEACLPRQEPEIDNLRSALNWALQQGHAPDLGAAIAASIVRLWQAVGLAAEARNWGTLALERIDAATRPDLRADLLLGLTALGSGDRFHDMAVSAHQIFERYGDDGGAADALYLLGWHSFLAGRTEAADDAVARASEIYRRAGPELALAKCINMRAVLAERRRDLVPARALLREAIEMFRALGDERRVGGTLTNLGSCEFAAEDHAQAERCYAEALEILSRKKNAEDLVILYGNILINRLALGDVPGARDAGLAGMRCAREMGDERYIAELVLDLGSVAARSGRTSDAGRLFGYARNRLESLGLGRIADVRESAERIKESLEARLDPAEIERLASEGAAWSEKQAIEEATKS